jgi:hypothetical protein
MLKDKFKFKTSASDVVYSAEKHNKWTYNVTWTFDGASQQSLYGVDLLESMIYSGAWKIVEDVQPTEKPKRSISININSAYAAAKWEYENNKLAWKPERSFQEILDKINDTIEEIYEKAMQQKEWLNSEHLCCGTGSWLVQFSPEDENYGTISVVIDVSTGMPIHYIDVEEYLQQA